MLYHATLPGHQPGLRINVFTTDFWDDVRARGSWELFCRLIFCIFTLIPLANVKKFVFSTFVFASLTIFCLCMWFVYIVQFSLTIFDSFFWFPFLFHLLSLPSIRKLSLALYHSLNFCSLSSFISPNCEQFVHTTINSHSFYFYKSVAYNQILCTCSSLSLRMSTTHHLQKLLWYMMRYLQFSCLDDLLQNFAPCRTHSNYYIHKCCG